jgi:hypothetical protein
VCFLRVERQFTYGVILQLSKYGSLVVDFVIPSVTTVLGRTMVQAVSLWPLTTEAQVCAQFSPCGICGGQSGTRTGFSPSSSILPCSIVIP